MIINNLDTTYITKHEFKKQQSTQYQLREFVHARIVVQHLESYVGKTIDGIVLFYVAKGQGTVYANGEHIGLKENDMIIINLDQSFYISSNDWEFIYFHLTIPKTINLFGNLDWKYSIKDPQNMQGIFYKLLNVSLQQNPFMINSFANLIFGELYHSKVNTYSEISHQDPLKKAVRYIESNIKTDIDLDEICNVAGFSKYHFIRLFKQELGVTPYQFLIDSRLTHAKYLLLNTTLKIKDIASECGFNSDMNFAYTFKNKMGVTPSNYKKNKEV